MLVHFSKIAIRKLEPNITNRTLNKMVTDETFVLRKMKKLLFPEEVKYFAISPCFESAADQMTVRRTVCAEHDHNAFENLYR
ncbi:hypothetical protein CEXT_491581 [Caerostris extrusa]|uniref:Uncharacterized protein n=1 Tax=Caerostris extrusa TaxID=172846 RepID=A0AAV4MCX1_CAEEX|nr:hypothetical protein CEXT_491581 [Caerostris extrusa]